MPFDPTKPANKSRLSSAEMRGQLNALKALIDDLQQQLAPLVPVLNRSAAGQWTLSYARPAQEYWQIWARSSGNAAWAKTGELSKNNFPAQDAVIAPDGASWWQVKLCGENDSGNQSTPFSNIISFGPVPA
jgi:hypothetical protein